MKPKEFLKCKDGEYSYTILEKFQMLIRFNTKKLLTQNQHETNYVIYYIWESSNADEFNTKKLLTQHQDETNYV